MAEPWAGPPLPPENARAARAAYLLGGEAAAERYLLSLGLPEETACPCPACDGTGRDSQRPGPDQWGCEFCGSRGNILLRHAKAHLDYVNTLAGARIRLDPPPTIADALAVQELGF